MESLRRSHASPPRDVVKAIRILISERRDYLVGIALLLVVVFLWTLANFATQDMFQRGYEKPFLITWLNMSSFTFYLIPVGLKLLGNESHDVLRHVRERSGYQRLSVGPIPRSYSISDDADFARCREYLPPLTTKETMKLGLICCFIWFATLWTVIASLDYTSVASSTIMASTSGLFTLGIGRIFKVESLSVTKVIAVVISFSGVLLVSLSDSSPTVVPEGASVASNAVSEAKTLVDGEGYSNPLLGDFLALASAIFSASYVILLKVKVREESRMNMNLFFAYVGLFNVLLFGPFCLILHLTGVESFELPTDRRVVGSLLLNMLVTVSSNFIYLVAMLKTTPLVVTLGLSLTIPVAAAGDLLLGRTVKMMTLLGAALVVGSFVFVGLEDSKEEELPAEEVDAGNRASIRLRVPSENGSML